MKKKVLLVLTCGKVDNLTELLNHALSIVPTELELKH